MPLALIFDVETTGLLPKNNRAPLSEFPHIIQFSFVLYDTDENKVKKVYNEYIQVDKEVELSPEINTLTGITRTMVDSQGIHICEAIQELFQVYMEADVLVGHNLDFDIKMVLAESARWDMNLIIDTFEQKCNMGGKPTNNKNLFDTSNPNFYCTMMHGIDICKIERINSRGPYLKQPKLSELYQYLFKIPPEGLHNSLVDVLTCLRCYVEIAHHFRIGHEAFEKILQCVL